MLPTALCWTWCRQYRYDDNNNGVNANVDLQDVWEPGLVGVSDGVMSVISDYCRPAPPLLRGYSPDIQRNKFLKLDRCW